MDRGAFWATVHIGLQRVRHVWSNLAHTHALVENSRPVPPIPRVSGCAGAARGQGWARSWKRGQSPGSPPGLLRRHLGRGVRGAGGPRVGVCAPASTLVTGSLFSVAFGVEWLSSEHSVSCSSAFFLVPWLERQVFLVFVSFPCLHLFLANSAPGLESVGQKDPQEAYHYVIAQTPQPLTHLLSSLHFSDSSCVCFT